MRNTIRIDYNDAKTNGVGANAEKAMQTFLAGDVGSSFTIFPQSLNPLLKALESVGLWRQVAVLPCTDRNKPLYTVIKLGDTPVEGLLIGEGE